MDVGGDFVRSSDDLVRLLYLDAKSVVIKMTLKPIVTMISFRQETKVANFHDPVSGFILIYFRRFLTFLSSKTLHVY